MPTIRSPSMKVTAYLDLLHPHSVDFTFDNVTKFVNTPFVLKTKKEKMAKTWGDKPMLILRGTTFVCVCVCVCVSRASIRIREWRGGGADWCVTPPFPAGGEG